MAEVVDALREGMNVVVAASLPSCPALSIALEDRIAEEWRIAGPIIASGIAPIDALYDALAIEGDLDTRRNVASLLESIESKRVILATGVDAPKWTAWKRFLEDYADASRAVATLDRTQLLVVTTGVRKERLPSKAPALRPLVWDGYVGEADVFSYITQAWRTKGKRIDAQAKLIARIVTRLALWDFDLIDRMLDLDPRELFDPVQAIRSAAAGMPGVDRISSSWEEGGIAEFDGEELEHAVALVREGDPRGELAMRLWAAQASEILPALEINRRKLAKRMKNARLPLHVTLNGERVDAEDIEIGPLLHLARVHRLPRDIVRIAEKFARLRNKLAHLSPLDADESLDGEVLGARRPPTRQQ